VGEAFDEKGSARTISKKRDEILMKYLGEPYIEECFLVARKSVPEAVLLYYDTCCHLMEPAGKSAKADRIYRMCQDFIKRGVPIHGNHLPSSHIFFIVFTNDHLI
jgi:GH35 family endo-1,4-beta-xylanase